MIKLFFALITFTSTLVVGNARAEFKGRDEKEFYILIANYRKACSVRCQAPFNSQPVFDILSSGQPHLPAEAQSNLSKVAFIQAQIWGDTILEGDYYSAGKTRLDQVLALFKNKTLIGYKITYSERAWFIGDCGFDGADEDALSACNEGRIHESTFVSPDFKIFFRDDKEFADFTT